MDIMKRTFLRSLSLAVAVWCSPAPALEYMPYPTANISVQQWQDYFQRVKKEYGNSLREFPKEFLVVFHSPDKKMHYAFTTPGHPAHPAWITRQVTEKDGQVFTNQIGYFAGKEEPFARLFRAYQELTARTVEKVRKEAGSNK